MVGPDEERVDVEPDLPGAYAQAVELAEDAEGQSGSGIVITGKRLVAFIVATRCMLRVGGIPVFESVQARVFSNKLLPVEDAY